MKLHFTPTYSSWLNQVESWSRKLQRDVIDRGIFTSVADLRRKILSYIRLYQKAAKTLSVEIFRCSQAHPGVVAMSQGQPTRITICPTPDHLIIHHGSGRAKGEPRLAQMFARLSRQCQTYGGRSGTNHGLWAIRKFSKSTRMRLLSRNTGTYSEARAGGQLFSCGDLGTALNFGAAASTGPEL